MATKKSRKAKGPSVEERLTAFENSVAAWMKNHDEIKNMLGTHAVVTLTERVQFLETSFKLLKPELQQVLGELRAVRNLLDVKKQYAHMDRPRPVLEHPPVGEGVIVP